MCNFPLRLRRLLDVIRKLALGFPPLTRKLTRSLAGFVDPKLANKLLDEVGLNKRGSDGIRLLPDGRPATIVVDPPPSRFRAPVRSSLKRLPPVTFTM